METTKKERLKNANELIKVLSTCGRKFFQHKGFTSYMEVSAQGHVYFHDYYTKKRIYTHYTRQWSGFTSGGTLRTLIECLRDYITRGEQMHRDYFIPKEPGEFGNPWGYGKDISIVGEAAVRLGIAK